MDEQQRVDFGRRVRDARVKRGWNQIELAEHAHVAPNTVGSIELGKRSPRPQSIEAIIEVLDLEPLDELPADVALVSQLVTLWMLAIPPENRATAVLDLVQFLREPESDPAPVSELKTTSRGFIGRTPQVEGTKTRQDH